jgi:hypothetical protein
VNKSAPARSANLWRRFGEFPSQASIQRTAGTVRQSSRVMFTVNGKTVAAIPASVSIWQTSDCAGFFHALPNAIPGASSRSVTSQFSIECASLRLQRRLVKVSPHSLNLRSRAMKIADCLCFCCLHRSSAALEHIWIASSAAPTEGPPC